MTVYVLFAARDGDVLHERGSFFAEADALRWAAGCIQDRFGLDRRTCEDFDEAAAECDGVLLEPDRSAAVKMLAVEWALTQAAYLSRLTDQLGDLAKSERSACLRSLISFANAMEAAG